jgi:glycerol-3-phosphate dehydrogenase
MRTLDVDVAIVGAGVVGCSIAARLSAARLTVCVLDRCHDVCEETSKATSAITDSGWESHPGSLEAQLLKASNPRWEEIAERLDVPFRRAGTQLIARSREQLRHLDQALGHAHLNRVAARRLDAAELRALCPYLASDVLAGVEVPADGVVDPIRLTLAYAELAARNGARFAFRAPVIAARATGKRIVEIYTPAMTVRPRFVVNAAGLGADAVSRALGAEEFVVWPRRGQYLVVDREVGREVERVVAQPPSEMGGGVMVIPTPSGALLLGPTAEEGREKEDRSTHSEVLADVFRDCQAMVPSLRREHVIASFCGLRAASDRTYRIELSERRSNVVQACGIRSTGVASAPAVADLVRELLLDAGLGWTPRPDALERLPRRVAAAPPGPEEIVCACERVSADAIRNALGGPLPARSVAAIAKRTRATVGRCQGNECLPAVVRLFTAAASHPTWSTPVTEPAATLGVAAASAVGSR